MVARMGVEPMTLRTKGVNSTKAHHVLQCSYYVAIRRMEKNVTR